MKENPVIPPESGLPTDLIPLNEAAKLIGTCRQTLLRWCIKGKIPAWRRGGHQWLVSRQDVLDMVQAHDPEKHRQEQEARRPATKREMTRRERITDELLREAGIRR